MYFKIDKESNLHKVLMQLKEDMKAANKEAFNLAKSLGFNQWRSPNNFTIAGGICSFYSENGEKPDNYGYTYGSKEPHDIFPKKIKANKELIAMIELLPTVAASRFTSPIKYDWRKHKSPSGKSHGASHVLFTPGLSFAKNNEILISFPDWLTDYKPVKGMIEITFTEHKKLNK